ncbi:CD276 antigen homolog [Labeo rohita]|uniref:CD276 antigen homolog n=1 Tax=Labeo rohita TaxID=84645 RepID=UPI0021E28D58|nr:CD276 antigen homolog [Labeo rohita]
MEAKSRLANCYLIIFSFYRCYVILTVLLLYITGSFSAPVGVTVRGFVGDPAILSCYIPESEIRDKLEEFKIHWRDDKGKKVCDFTGGNTTCQNQDPKYKDRVETLPEESKKGTFSIKLNGLQNSDAKKYHCYTTEPNQYETIIELHVEKSRANHGEPSWIVLLISLITILLLHLNNK